MNEATADNLEARLREFLLNAVASELDKDPTQIDPRAPISSLGVDSAVAVTITVALEKHTGLRLSPALAWDYPTIDQLASHVAGLVAAAKGAR